MGNEFVRSPEQVQQIMNAEAANAAEAAIAADTANDADAANASANDADSEDLPRVSRIGKKPKTAKKIMKLREAKRLKNAKKRKIMDRTMKLFFELDNVDFLKNLIGRKIVTPKYRSKGIPLIKLLVTKNCYNTVTWMLSDDAVPLEKIDVASAYKSACALKLPNNPCIRQFHLCAATRIRFMDTTELFLHCVDRKNFDIILNHVLNLEDFDPNEIFGDNETPLHLVVKHKQFHCAKKLIALGAAVEASDYYKRSPLTLAVDNLDDEMVRLLLQNGADPNPSVGPFWLGDPTNDKYRKIRVIRHRTCKYPDYTRMRSNVRPMRLKVIRRADKISEYLVAAGLDLTEHSWVNRTIIVGTIGSRGAEILRTRVQTPWTFTDRLLLEVRKYLVSQTNGGRHYAKMCYALEAQKRLYPLHLKRLLVKSI